MFVVDVIDATPIWSFVTPGALTGLFC